MATRGNEDSLQARHYLQRLAEHNNPAVVKTEPAMSRPTTHRQVMVGDKLMIMNDAGGLDDPHGLCDSIRADHIHIKRPMNAFMCWAQIARRRLADEKPELRNTELSKILGQMWKELNKDQKNPYIKKAEQLRLQHKTQYPNYKYRPKRKKHSKYAIVPSPEVLNPAVSKTRRESCEGIKLSHPSYLYNIVKEENSFGNQEIKPRSVSPPKEVQPGDHVMSGYYPNFRTHHPGASKDTPGSSSGGYSYHGYHRYSPYYNDLTSYTRDLGYYSSTPTPAQSNTLTFNNPPSSHHHHVISSPTITSSNIPAEELFKQSKGADHGDIPHLKDSYNPPSQLPYSLGSATTAKQSGPVTQEGAKTLKISNITGRIDYKSAVPHIASYIQF